MSTRVQTRVQALQLAPHPEGGFYRRIHASPRLIRANGVSRPALTAIDYLLPGGMHSHWHRVDATETWHWLEGAALELSLFDASTGALNRCRLDSTSASGRTWQAVEPGVWQSACSHGEYSLMRCTVSPGFVWQGFEILSAGHEVAAQLRQLGIAVP